MKKEGKYVPLLCHTRKWYPNQSRLYTSLELETLILIDSLEKMRYFSRYFPKGLICHTDAKSIVFMANAHFSTGNQHLERWT